MQANCGQWILPAVKFAIIFITNCLLKYTVESACGEGILGRKAAKTADEVIFESKPSN